jgi:hypothetical protein
LLCRFRRLLGVELERLAAKFLGFALPVRLTLFAATFGIGLIPFAGSLKDAFPVDRVELPAPCIQLVPRQRAPGTFFWFQRLLSGALDRLLTALFFLLL